MTGLITGNFQLLIIFLLSSFSTPNSINTSIIQFNEVMSQVSSEVLINKPLIRFESVTDETILNSNDYNGKNIESKMNEAARNAVGNSNFKIAEISDDGYTAGFGDLCSKLNAMSSRLASGYISDEATIIFHQLSSENQNLLILSQCLIAKVGPKGSYNSYTGAITSKMFSYLLKASLINCSTGQVLWKNEVFIRKLPDVDKSSFAESLTQLYVKFPNKQ
jgi:hypothetical protein